MDFKCDLTPPLKKKIYLFNEKMYIWPLEHPKNAFSSKIAPKQIYFWPYSNKGSYLDYQKPHVEDGHWPQAWRQKWRVVFRACVPPDWVTNLRCLSDVVYLVKNNSLSIHSLQYVTFNKTYLSNVFYLTPWTRGNIIMTFVYQQHLAIPFKM